MDLSRPAQAWGDSRQGVGKQAGDRTGFVQQKPLCCLDSTQFSCGFALSQPGRRQGATGALPRSCPAQMCCSLMMLCPESKRHIWHIWRYLALPLVHLAKVSSADACDQAHFSDTHTFAFCSSLRAWSPAREVMGVKGRYKLLVLETLIKAALQPLSPPNWDSCC